MNERRTRQLEATYEAVQSARDHPTAEQVFDRVRAVVAQVSLGTVYRNLKKLAAQGRVRIVQQSSPSSSARFEAVLTPHEHFVCEMCGTIVDLPSKARTFPDTAALRRAGYGINGHALTFFGTCPSCRTATSGPGQGQHGGSGRGVRVGAACLARAACYGET